MHKNKLLAVIFASVLGASCLPADDNQNDPSEVSEHASELNLNNATKYDQRYCFYKISVKAEFDAHAAWEAQMENLKILYTLYEDDRLLLPPVMRNQTIWMAQGCDERKSVYSHSDLEFLTKETTYKEYMSEYLRASSDFP